MTQEIFNQGMDLLIGGKRPFKWTNDSKGAYWAVLHAFDGEEFYAACKRLNITAEEMPSAGAIARAINPQKTTTLKLVGCALCAEGKIRYMYHSPDGLKYDRYAACSCGAGDKVARHMLQMQKLRADSNGYALRADKMDITSYRMSAVRLRYGDSIMPEGFNEHKSVADVEVPPEANVRLRRQIMGTKETMLRILEKAGVNTNATDDINDQLRGA